MDMFAMTLDVDQVLAGDDGEVVDGQYAIMDLLLDNVRLRRSLNRHLGVRCVDTKDIGIQHSTGLTIINK